MLIGEYFAGNAQIATTVLTGTCGVVYIGDSIAVYDRPLFLKHLRFRNLVGCQLNLLITSNNAELIGPTAPITGTFTQPNSGTAGPLALPGDQWLHQRNAFLVTGGTTAAADGAFNTNRVFDSYCPTTAGLVYRPRGTGLFLDGKDLKASFFGYRHANGLPLKLAFTDYAVSNQWATDSTQTLNGTAGAVQLQIASTGAQSHGTNGFRFRQKLIGGGSVPTNSSVIGHDGFIEVNGETGQTFALMALSGWRALDYITTSNITVAAFATQLQLYRATICIINLDENSVVNGESTTTYATRIAALMDNCKVANAAMQFVLVSQYDNTAAGITSANLRLTALAGKSLALSRSDTLWLDCNGAFGDTAFLVAEPLVDTDTVHPVTTGAADPRKGLWVVKSTNEMLEMAHAANSAAPRILRTRGRLA